MSRMSGKGRCVVASIAVAARKSFPATRVMVAENSPGAAIVVAPR